jgi:hypothetical protein
LRSRPVSMGGRLHGSHLARRTPVQPVQLSLIPDQVPPPPDTLIAELPEARVAEAVDLLAALIAKTVSPPPLAGVESLGVGGE